MMEVVVTTGLLELQVVHSSSQIITTNKPTSSFFSFFLQAGCPSCHPTNSVKARLLYGTHFLLTFVHVHFMALLTIS